MRWLSYLWGLLIAPLNPLATASHPDAVAFLFVGFINRHFTKRHFTPFLPIDLNAILAPAFPTAFNATRSKIPQLSALLHLPTRPLFRRLSLHYPHVHPAPKRPTTLGQNAPCGLARLGIWPLVSSFKFT